MLSMNTHWFTYTLVPSLITASIPKFWNCLQLLISLFLRVIGLCISRALSGLFVVRSRGWKKWSILLIKYKEDHQEDNHTSKGMLMWIYISHGSIDLGVQTIHQLKNTSASFSFFLQLPLPVNFCLHFQCIWFFKCCIFYSDYKPHMFKHKMVTLSALRIDN